MSRSLARLAAVALAVVLGMLMVTAARGDPRTTEQRFGDAVSGSGYQWPLAGEPRVSRGFEPPARRWLPGHRGVDLASEPGALVLAAGSGLVTFADAIAGTGVVSVTHAGELRTTYQPVTPTVAAGDMVAAGDPIGLLEAGHAGCTAFACLHWGLRQGEFYLDPLSLLGLGQVRLLPRPADASGGRS